VAADFSLPDGQGNMVNLADQLQENDQEVLVFYYGTPCRPCMAQLSEIANYSVKYEDKSAQVIAVAVQDERGAGLTADFIDAQFPVLADRKRSVAEAYGVLEEGGLSTPSVFIIDKDKQIVWSEISHIEGSGCGTERVPSQTILENLGQKKGSKFVVNDLIYSRIKQIS
jgi:peroxiredoxin Q/BCP